jgi:hypothetical protein
LGHFRQRFPAKPSVNFSQTDSLRVREPQSLFDLFLENPVLRHQVFVLQEQFLVNRTGDVRQHSFPIYRGELTAATACAQPPDCPVRSTLKIGHFEFLAHTGK